MTIKKNVPIFKVTNPHAELLALAKSLGKTPAAPEVKPAPTPVAAEVVEKAAAPKSTDDTIETEKHTDPSVDLTIQLLTNYYKDWQHPGSKYKNREMKGY